MAGVYVGTEQLSLALQGSGTGTPALHFNKPYDLDLTAHPGGSRYDARPSGADADSHLAARRRLIEDHAPVRPRKRHCRSHLAARRRLIEDVAKLSPARGDLLAFVQRCEVQTYATIHRLKEIAKADQQRYGYPRPFGHYENGRELALNLNLIA